MVFGAALMKATTGGGGSWRLFYTWPFHRVRRFHGPPGRGCSCSVPKTKRTTADGGVQEPIFGIFGLHFVIGFLVAVLPVYHTMTAALGTPVYCDIWGCPSA